MRRDGRIVLLLFLLVLPAAAEAQRSACKRCEVIDWGDGTQTVICIHSHPGEEQGWMVCTAYTTCMNTPSGRFCYEKCDTSEPCLLI